jgi:glutaredoxin
MTSKWVILTKPECPWCHKAKDLFHEHHIEFTEFDVLECQGLYGFMVHSGLTSVPQIFDRGHLIGGYDDLKIDLESPLVS